MNFNKKIFFFLILLFHTIEIFSMSKSCTYWCNSTCTSHIKEKFCCSYDENPTLENLLVESCPKELHKGKRNIFLHFFFQFIFHSRSKNLPQNFTSSIEELHWRSRRNVTLWYFLWMLCFATLLRWPLFSLLQNM